MSESTHQDIAPITGASTGIGAVYADRLAQRGYDLILVARDAEKLSETAARLKSIGRTIETIPADLTNAVDVERIAERLRSDSRITALVNNAGLGSAGKLLASNIDNLESMIYLNVTALTRLALSALPGFIARKRGLLINIASVVALAPERLNGTYSGTKAYVVNFTQALHEEVASMGVTVQVVLPGATATPFWAKAGRPVEQLPSEIVMSAEDMVDAALAGLNQHEVVTIPALPNIADWNNFEAARKALGPNLSHRKPAARYEVGAELQRLA
ncbi:SDR family NAD(P)-dependent oxidoreductase [Edaphobacter flagellatus]|uniref:SDR family NAD(P)-dependent oxidoreductase n=1 Tax=Edaphobacter flagellatus TaxID=1933044 RepID=UPI0021B30BF8|nr:SDR family oxidoreductase [Edaphobacter flagellatus]